MAIVQEWFTPSQLAAAGLPGIPTSTANVIALANREEWRRIAWKGTRWRNRAAAGGGFEYHWSVLPPAARLSWSVAHQVIDEAAERSAAERLVVEEALWREFFLQTEKIRNDAARRLQALDMIVDLVAKTSRPRSSVLKEVGEAFGFKKSAIYQWEAKVKGIDRTGWLPRLAPNWKGRTSEAYCSPKAWDALYKEYARGSKPNFNSCYRKIAGVAAQNGWIIPSEDTLWRRMRRVDPNQLAYARGGEEGVDKMMPYQERDKSVYHALEAVNADGHKFNVRVMWEDGKIDRPMVVVFQDLMSGKILSHRVDKTENTNVIRLAAGDVIEKYGIFPHCFFDNGRAFASKEMTGGTEHRFRFRAADDGDEPLGILVRLGTRVHFTTPYSGRSKPVERSFGDFAREVAKDIRFEGCYVGDNALDKPYMENSVQNFPDSGGKQRPIVSTLVHAIIRLFGRSFWGVAHGLDCRDPAPSFGKQGEHQFDRA